MIIWEIFFLALALGFLIGFVIGGFMQWDSMTPTIKGYKKELFEAYREQEELRELLHAKHQLPIRQAKGN